MRIDGERIYLREWKMSDAKDMAEMLNHKVYSDFTHIPHPYKLKYAKDFIKLANAKKKKKTDFSFGVFLKKTNELIGGLAFHNVDYRDHHAMVGYWMGTKHHGRGYTTEACRVLIRYGYEKLKLNRIVIEMKLHNKASKRVAEKLGAKFEGVARERMYVRGRYYDMFVYSILKKEFKKQKKKRKTKTNKSRKKNKNKNKK